MNENQEHLPIKIVVTSDADMRTPHGGGGKRKDFGERLDEALRVSLLRDVGNLAGFFDAEFTKSNLPAVARVRLAKDAIAKSHRPSRLLDRTCPIIGNEDFGELLVSVRPEGLARFKDLVGQTTDKKIISDLGKITAIEPYRVQDVIGGQSIKHFTAHLREAKVRELKYRLFTHRESRVDRELILAMEDFAKSLGMEAPVEMRYAPGLRLYRVVLPSPETAVELAGFVGAQSLDQFHHFSVSTQATRVGNITASEMPPPDANTEYPVVGVIDSGTDPNNQHLQAWVEVRDEEDVPALDQNNEHGSLVAGLIVNGRMLNHDADGFPRGRARVVDVVAYPSTGVREDVLVETMRRAFAKYPHVKIWNLSLNDSANPVVSERFSTFAMALDTLQDQFDVTIVNSAGNFRETPAHAWPRGDLGQRDRILPPADSLRGISVGSQAHLAHNGACAKVGEPSPFTRKGPGAAYVPKPEVTHFGGNTDALLRYGQMGILSVDGSGGLSEVAGTSFAAPLVAATAAHVAHQMARRPSRNLLKALITHSAVLHSPEVTAATMPYTGFGRPPEPEMILRCRPWESTLIFELELPYMKRLFQKLDFPIPPCLHKDGKVFGEFTMTLVYDSPTDPSDGAAYSQVNLDPSLGPCDMDGVEVLYRGGQIFPYPKDFRELFETSQIEHGFKWSPTKVYRRTMTRLDPRDKWRIGLDMSTRKPEFTPPARQKAVLVVTIADPGKSLPVYNEVVVMMRHVSWQTENLQIRADTRIRVQ